MNAGHPSRALCPSCRTPMWWDVTYPYLPTWYCSGCRFPAPARRTPDPRLTEERAAPQPPGR
ncbi:hypothetical protein ACFV3R_01385 [Streptomyces sp. NPDC059740]|uniref:hypothetical protein n=1 Tax=Streptomyces sp. NPDC059740 TaxID=3346926 RepID=UPI00366206A0